MKKIILQGIFPEIHEIQETRFILASVTSKHAQSIELRFKVVLEIEYIVSRGIRCVLSTYADVSM